MKMPLLNSSAGSRCFQTWEKVQVRDVQKSRGSMFKKERWLHKYCTYIWIYLIYIFRNRWFSAFRMIFFNPNMQVVIHFFTSLTHPVLNTHMVLRVFDKKWSHRVRQKRATRDWAGLLLSSTDSSERVLQWLWSIEATTGNGVPVVSVKLDVFFWGTFFWRVLKFCQNLMGELWDFPRNPNELNSKIEIPYWLEWGFILDRLGRWSCYKIHNRKHQPSVMDGHWWGMAVVLSSTLRGHWTRTLGMIFSGRGDGDTKLGGEKILLGGHRLYQLTWSASGLKMTFWSFFFGRWRHLSKMKRN